MGRKDMGGRGRGWAEGER